MCFVRKGMDKIFDQKELKWLDDIMPEAHKRAKEDEQIKQEEVTVHLFLVGGLYHTACRLIKHLG